jgi:hypothetical protein
MFKTLNNAIKIVAAFYSEGYKDMIRIQLEYNSYSVSLNDYEKREVRLAWLKQLNPDLISDERKEELDFLEWYLRKYPRPTKPI